MTQFPSTSQPVPVTCQQLPSGVGTGLGVTGKGALKVLGVVALCVASATLGYKSNVGMSPRVTSAFASKAPGSAVSVSTGSASLSVSVSVPNSGDVPCAACEALGGWCEGAACVFRSEATDSAASTSTDYTPVNTEDTPFVYDCDMGSSPGKPEGQEVHCKNPDLEKSPEYPITVTTAPPTEYQDDNNPYKIKLGPHESAYIKLSCTSHVTEKGGGPYVRNADWKKNDFNCKPQGGWYNDKGSITYLCENKSGSSHHTVEIKDYKCSDCNNDTGCWGR